MKQHPEQTSDEIYMGNATEQTFEKSDWKTKRWGVKAHDSDGVPLGPGDSMKPWFISRGEVQQTIAEMELAGRGASVIPVYQKMLDT